MSDNGGAGKTSLGPQSINSLRFAEARASELRAMALVLGVHREHKTVPSKYPRHMRRRATSHKSYQMPVRLRCAPEGDTPAALKRKRQQERQAVRRQSGADLKPRVAEERCRRHTRRGKSLQEGATNRDGSR